MSHERKDGKINLKNEARTPPTLFKRLDDRFQFDCDLFATGENTLCDCYFSKDEPKGSFHPRCGDGVQVCMGNALEQNWVASNYYGNPPYSNPGIFVKKAYEESLKGSVIVMLLPADISTKWFHDYCMDAAKWIIIKGRVRFDNPDGTPMPGSPKFGSIVVVFDECERTKNGHLVVETMDWK